MIGYQSRQNVVILDTNWVCSHEELHIPWPEFIALKEFMAIGLWLIHGYSAMVDTVGLGSQRAYLRATLQDPSRYPSSS